MRKKVVSAAFLSFFLGCMAASAQVETITWSADARQIYDSGFMHKLMKDPNGGVRLFNNEPVENDSPGAGVSDKGVNTDEVWGSNRARKVLALDDPRAAKAWLFIFLNRRGKFALTFEVNGHRSQMETWQSKGYERFRWVEFPAEWLKKGKNVIDLSCPEAKTAAEGWSIYLARADEFEAGGGDPKEAGKTSFKSANGGETWKESPFGPLGQDRAEYEVRICLNRYVKSGWLETPVIDLWKKTQEDLIVQMHTIQKLRISAESAVPPGTTVAWYMRKGTNASPFSSEWEPYEAIGSGPAVSLEMEGKKFLRRYLQLKAVLSTENPLVSPAVKAVKVSADFKESFPVPLHKNIYVVEADNPPIQYSSVNWVWEKADRPEYEKLRKRENLDKVIAGSRTQFEAQVKLLDYATKRWRWNEPNPEYPEWDALSILDRIDKAGGGGMCIQFNLLLAGACMSYGWQARLVGIDGHEVCEVWSDDYGKWIYFDAYNWNHVMCDARTGKPLSMLELHKIYLDYFYPDRPMDWLSDYRFGDDAVAKRADKPPIIRSSSTYNDRASGDYGGFMQSRILRIIPRNNWFEKSWPRPLSHGTDSSWPWDGYITWYDDRTPPRIQYSWYTDRPRDMWPDLNKTHISAAQGYGNDRLYLEFETYTPNFSHFEVNTDDNGWEKTEDRWNWLLVPGKNTVQVRAVNKQGSKGKPASITVNRVELPFKEWEMK